MREAIIVQRLGKRFNRYHAEKPVTIMEAALSGLRRMKPVEHFWALRDVSFTVSPGQMLGVLGHNGAGKSTLLQLIGGVGRPDEGRVKVKGRIGALLDLGAGFHGDLTGRENVFVTTVVAGLTRREVARRFDAIVEFAELEQFIDNPVRTYSTGMQMRLAFSVAVHTNPDVLLVDEFLSVGDLAFQAKCLQRIAQLKADGCAIVLISHSSEQIQELCDQALWLRHGQVVAHGEPEVVAGQYVSEMRHQTQQRTPVRPPQLTNSGVELRVNENRFGSLEVEIADVRLLPVSEIKSGDSLCVEIEYLSPQPIDSPIFSVAISREDGQICFDTNTEVMSVSLPLIQGEGQVKLHLERLDLNGGKYFIDVGIYEPTWAYAYDYHWHVYPLEIQSPVNKNGILSPPLRWEISSAQIQALKNIKI
ncbi:MULTISPECIES: ABC transporter ATP-binding protein [unclassified Coleofasciculus]|uniref:ABC transporter ATP-binding protein n=1 Tax=unclassified Coleofasciculus TaxID=2692782 RepID=UPI00188296CA|nr:MULTISPECIES: ABC transporter ATP-binding protein [unclassified Coleofasciculus]MBE9127584.1 ABC transporter ATP-binding protein [Coleofasciculus sp. LEGE 07081]MBE9149785.1 ABC transporter ATP-binding protein [Coleofasciculus sp. LEGE 07092]